MATAVEAAIIEIQAALDEMVLAHEGLRDLSSLDLQPAAQQVVLDMIERFDRRKAFLEAALLACQNLMADGYPGLEVQEISQPAFADLSGNVETIQAALAKFTPDVTTTLGLTPGAPVPK